MKGFVAVFSRSIWATLAFVAASTVAAVFAGIAFDLTLSGSIALYFVVWWTLLFAVLPVRMMTQAESGVVTEGTDPGAPAAPALCERAIWTSIVSTVVFACIAAFFPLAGL